MERSQEDYYTCQNCSTVSLSVHDGYCEECWEYLREQSEEK